MVIRTIIGRSTPALALVLAALVAIAQPASPVRAASAVQALVAKAERNTNTVRTLVHHDKVTTIASNGSVTVSAHGTEDEVRNREQDYESVHVTRRASGKVSKLAYTVDLIFLNGSTYYRLSTAPTTWKMQKGMIFPDPYTGGWKRGRTTVTTPAGLAFKLVGTSGGQTHVRASLSSKTSAGTIDLWITTGSKPYIVQEDVAVHSTTGTRVSQTSQVKFGPFNSNVDIQPPAQASA
jgi:hypothetical protein